MKFINDEFSKLFKSKKSELYTQNIKTIKVLSIYYVITLIIFSIMATLTFTKSPIMVRELIIIYSTMGLVMVIMYFITRRIEKKKVCVSKLAVVLTYASIFIGMLFITIISIFISEVTVRPAFFLLFNVILTSLFILRKRDFVVSIILSAMIFIALSVTFRFPAFTGDLYLVLCSVVIGIPYNVVIYNIKMKDEYTKQLYYDEANIDTLSGLANRRAFDRNINSVYSTNSDSQDVLFAIFDLDNFKLINDTKGHAYGDNLIKVLGAAIKRFAEDYQLFIARIGGDEFALIGLNLQEPMIAKVLEELISVISKIKTTESDELLSLSIGAFYTKTPSKYLPQDIVVKADKALYYIKNNEKGSIRVIMDR